ncbi:hypothetical protein ACFSKU_15060 [Pontibacter silvestris]|uniref:Uncharacterized protein n=1 Tax=Pontibacter silvestris TaxID=2305183 RepID=A0ABW4X1R3_9BACT|nr:hypothetical protein [Pontibacter silvestris]
MEEAVRQGQPLFIAGYKASKSAPDQVSIKEIGYSMRDTILKPAV